MTPPSQDATDIFSLTDHALADRLQFIKEIGFGNWGSVWLCSPKSEEEKDVKLAVKLVHRSKTTTTAARVRSLWNEMKIVRTLKKDAHPSIVPFHSFIITPSYALITMAYLPQLIPVEVPEPRAKEWLHSLLDAVAFLHRRGVVHNDIKPANILLSQEKVPVLVDFGFAEKYDTKNAQAFHSNLTYGTPEYLSPERARGLPHDTRKADVWALGVTFFEILVGRTPFEAAEGESFTSKEDLEKYWQRTMRGKWVGAWKISKAAERLLRRMVQPNADVRCNAPDALADAYWIHHRETVSSMHKRASSAMATSTPTHKRTGSAGILDIISPWATRRLSKDLVASKIPTSKIAPKASASKLAPKDKAAATSKIGSLRPKPSLTRKESNISAKLVRKESIASGLAHKDSLAKIEDMEVEEVKESPRSKSALATLNGHGRSQSQIVSSRTAALQASTVNGKRLAPIPGSPASARRPAKENRNKENTASPGMRRKPIPSALTPVAKAVVSPPSKPAGLTPLGINKPATASKAAPPPGLPPAGHRRTGALTDVTARTRNGAHLAPADADSDAVDISAANTTVTGNASGFSDEGKSVGSVRDRMREWERVREAMRAQATVAVPSPGLRAVTPSSDHGASPILVATHIDSEDEEERPFPERRDSGFVGNWARASSQSRTSSADYKLQLPRPAKHAFRPTHARSRTPEPSMPSSPLSPDMNFDLFQDSVPRASHEQSMGESGLNVLRQSFKASIDRSFNLYKASLNLGLGFSRRPSTSASERVPDLSLAELGPVADASFDKDKNESGDASLAVIRQARRNDRAGADSRADRMTLWLQNVEKVVDEARQNFAASSSSALPPLPLAPARSSSHNRDAGASSSFRASNRMPRKILAASEIFDASYMSAAPSPTASYGFGQTANSTTLLASTSSRIPGPNETIPTIPSESFLESPRRARRATVLGLSPEKSRNIDTADLSAIEDSPHKKSRSQNDLQLQRAILPRAKLSLELDRLTTQVDVGPPSSRRLSAYVDRDVFMSSTSSTPGPGTLNFDDLPQTPLLDAPHTPTTRLSLTPPVANSLTSSPFEVKPYPARTVAAPAIDSPTARRVEGVYDRFLMATSGVRRHGRGYEASSRGGAPVEHKGNAPVEHLVSNTVSSPAGPTRPPLRLFHTARRAMPPPVSSADVFTRRSEDLLRARAGHEKENRTVKTDGNKSVDELGIMHASHRDSALSPGGRTSNTAVRTVRDAFKAIVRRPSSRLVA